MDNMQNLKDRVSWAINTIKGDKLLFKEVSDVDLSKQLDISEGTLTTYKKGRGIIKATTIEGLEKYHHFSIDWLYHGKGEPFPGARNKYKDVCGPEEFQMVKEVNPNYSIPAIYATSDMMFSSDQKINIDEAIGKTIRVLSAGTALSVALYMNIQQFAAALNTSQELKECKELIKGLQAQIDDLREQLDRLSVPSTAGRQDDGSEKEVI